jgi:Transglycosylase SLT domain
MRPLFALAILIVGLKAAVPEATFQDATPLAGERPFAASLKIDGAIGETNRKLALAMPIEPSDAPHRQGEDAIEPPRPPAPASTKLDVQEDAGESIDNLCDAMLVSAETNGLPVPFFANLIWQESRLRHDAVSRVGALGIAQFMPEVASEVGLGDPFDPRQAIPASARFLHGLRDQFGNLGYVAAAYNAGAHRVAEWLNHRRALPRETQTYVVRVTGRSAEAWRTSPPDDSQLTFVRLLPCRQLAAYVDVEQTRLREAQRVEERLREVQRAEEAQRQLRAHEQKVAAADQRRTAANPAKRGAQKVALKSKAPGRLSRVAARKEPRAVTGGGAEKVARNFHAARRDAARHERAPHEKRKIA